MEKIKNRQKAPGGKLDPLFNFMTIRQHDTNEVINVVLGELRGLKTIMRFQAGILRRAKERAEGGQEEKAAALVQMIDVPPADVFEANKLKLGLLGDVLASDVKYFGLIVRNDQAAYKVALVAQGVGAAAGYLHDRRNAHVGMINVICERLEQAQAGKQVPDQRLWDMRFAEEPEDPL